MGLTVGLVALLVAPWGVATYGAAQVRAARAQVAEAETVLAARMENELHLRDELALLGAARPPLDQAFAAWARTVDEPERADRALAFIDLAETTLRLNVGLSDSSHEALQVRSRLERLASARTALVVARDEQAAVRDSLPARFASAVGWVAP